MKAAISIPESLFAEADAAARQLGVSRSKLVRIALEEFLKRKREDAIAKSIDRYIAKHGTDLSEEDEAWLVHGRETVRRSLEELERPQRPVSKRKKRTRQ
jgi:metal-responsive CopG/Arc/MetJ family transcriptional regulator